MIVDKDWNRDSELRWISGIIWTTLKKSDPNNRSFHPILKHELVSSCDQVFIERLRKNAAGLKMAFWKDHFEHHALNQYSEIKGTILDFGCGSGHSTILLARNGYVIHGIDMSPIGISIAKNLMKLENESTQKRVSFSITDVLKQTPKTHQLHFDSIWSSHVFEHILDPAPILKGLKKWVKKGAYILISVPYGDAYDDPGHVHHFWSASQIRDHFKNEMKICKIDIDKQNHVIRVLGQLS